MPLCSPLSRFLNVSRVVFTADCSARYNRKRDKAHTHDTFRPSSCLGNTTPDHTTGIDVYQYADGTTTLVMVSHDGTTHEWSNIPTTSLELPSV